MGVGQGRARCLKFIQAPGDALLACFLDAQALLGRVELMEGDLERTTSLLGHSNPAQRLQYHRRLKSDLEAMRRDCTTMLRERFGLEQCVR